MYDIDLVMQLIDWNAPEEDQKKGIFMAEKVKNIKCFMRPMGINEGKKVWENCAVIIAAHKDEEIRSYLDDLFIWLQDMNWPGAWIILDRLNRLKNYDWFQSSVAFARKQAKMLCDEPWLDNLSLLKTGHPDNLETIFDLIDERRSLEEQEKGIELGKTIIDIGRLIQPEDYKHARYIWKNCAKIIAQRNDQELRGYIPQLLEWLKDMNAPGAEIIYERLRHSMLTALIEKIFLFEEKQQKEHLLWLNRISTLLNRDQKDF